MSDIKYWLAECLQTLPDNLASFKADIEEHFQRKLTSFLRENNIVTREELELQCKILRGLEARLSELEDNKC